MADANEPELSQVATMQVERMAMESRKEVDSRWDLVAWNEGFRTGDAGIDSDHQKLLGLFNEFTMAVNAGKSDAIIRAVLDDLLEYTNYHFAREEALMREHDYPEFERHKKMHDTFARQISDVSHHLDVGGDMGAFLLSFLAKWLSGHIMAADRKLGDFLGSCGVKSAH